MSFVFRSVSWLTRSVASAKRCSSNRVWRGDSVSLRRNDAISSSRNLICAVSSAEMLPWFSSPPSSGWLPG